VLECWSLHAGGALRANELERVACLLEVACDGVVEEGRTRVEAAGGENSEVRLNGLGTGIAECEENRSKGARWREFTMGRWCGS